MLAREDLIIRSARNWSKQAGTQDSDTAVCAIVEMHRIVVSLSQSPCRCHLADTSRSAKGRILTVLHSDSAGVPKNLD